MKMETVINAYHIRVNKICAACQHKEVLKDGSRVCTKMQLMVAARHNCKEWAMSDGLKKAGLQTGAVVRLKGTQEIVIH